jgi:GTP cyclohydrolase I
MSNNARSPPTHPSVLSERAALKEKATSPLQRPTSRLPPSKVQMPSAANSAIYARQQREGYGFRPSSGTSTPTGGAGMGSAFPSFSSGRGYEDDDVDHRPDGRTLEDLRQGVRDELVKNDLIEHDADADETIELQKATQELALASGGGIADEQGLGWAGKS